MSVIKQKRMKKTTNKQYSLMIDFISKNKEMNSCSLSPSFTAKRRNELWEELTSILNNADQLGPQKTNLKWRKTWSDYKTEVKNKIAEAKKRSNSIDGAPNLTENMSPLQEKVANLLAEQTSMEGDENGIETDQAPDADLTSQSTNYYNIIHIKTEPVTLDSEIQDDENTNLEQNGIKLTESELATAILEQTDIQLTDEEDRYETSVSDTGTQARTETVIGNSPEPKTRKRKHSLKHRKNEDAEDLHNIVEAELKKAAAINKVALAIEERNLIEAERNQLLKNFVDLFSNFVNK